MADAVEFELVTPEKLLLSEDVFMVVIPGGDGDFGVLPGHSPMISTVRPGVVNIHDKDKVIQSIFVSGGFAEVSTERCTLLAADAVDVADIDSTEVQDKLADAKERLQAAELESPEVKIIEAEIAIHEAMAAAVSGVSSKLGH